MDEHRENTTEPCSGTKEKGERMTKFRKGQKVRVSFEATVIEDHNEARVRIRHADGAYCTTPRSSVEPIDDPASDPVGTVRRFATARHGGLVMVRMAHPHREFDDLYWCAIDGASNDSWNGDGVMEGTEIIGAVPGTPAAQTESDGSAWEVYGSGE